MKPASTHAGILAMVLVVAGSAPLLMASSAPPARCQEIDGGRIEVMPLRNRRCSRNATAGSGAAWSSGRLLFASNPHFVAQGCRRPVVDSDLIPWRSSVLRDSLG
jgi:hypothetical protein